MARRQPASSTHLQSPHIQYQRQLHNLLEKSQNNVIQKNENQKYVNKKYEKDSDNDNVK